MSCLGNLIWIIFGGLFNALAWLGFGLLWCITIVGIPIGLQCFKMAVYNLRHLEKRLLLRMIVV